MCNSVCVFIHTRLFLKHCITPQTSKSLWLLCHFTLIGFHHNHWALYFSLTLIMYVWLLSRCMNCPAHWNQRKTEDWYLSVLGCCWSGIDLCSKCFVDKWFVSKENASFWRVLIYITFVKHQQHKMTSISSNHLNLLSWFWLHCGSHGFLNQFVWFCETKRVICF